MSDELNDSQPEKNQKPSEHNYQPAANGARLMAGVIDLIVIFAVYYIFMSLMRIPHHIAPNSIHKDLYIFGDLVAYFLALLCMAAIEYFWCCSPGKYISKLKIVSKSGDLITFKQALIRNLMRFIEFPVLYIVILFNKKHKRLGDFLAGTHVVNK